MTKRRPAPTKPAEPASEVTPAAALLSWMRAKQAESADRNLESQVRAQLREAERVKARARKAAPRAHAALKTAFKTPELLMSDEVRYDHFMRECWRIS